MRSNEFSSTHSLSESIESEAVCVEESIFETNPAEHMEEFDFAFEGVTFNCTKHGNPKGPVILTLHDIGQNSSIAFYKFFDTCFMDSVLKEFSVVHVTLPGQWNVKKIVKNYPGFDSLVICLNELIRTRCEEHVIGMGIGAGGNLLIRAYLRKPEFFRRLILINTYISTMTWGEWLHQKYCTYNAENGRLNEHVINLLLDHFFDSVEDSDAIYQIYLNYLEKIPDSRNLLALLDSWASRSMIKLVRPSTPFAQGTDRNKQHDCINCETLVLVSHNTPFYEQCAELENLIDPSLIEYIEFSNGHGMLLDQFPAQVSQAIVLFLKGMGYLRGVEIPDVRQIKKFFKTPAEIA